MVVITTTVSVFIVSPVGVVPATVSPLVPAGTASNRTSKSALSTSAGGGSSHSAAYVSAVPHTMLSPSSAEVPQTMLNPSSAVPQTMLKPSGPSIEVPHATLSQSSPRQSVPQTMLSASSRAPQTMLNNPSWLGPQTMLSPA